MQSNLMDEVDFITLLYADVVHILYDGAWKRLAISREIEWEWKLGMPSRSASGYLG